MIIELKQLLVLVHLSRSEFLSGPELEHNTTIGVMKRSLLQDPICIQVRERMDAHTHNRWHSYNADRWDGNRRDQSEELRRGGASVKERTWSTNQPGNNNLQTFSTSSPGDTTAAAAG